MKIECLIQHEAIKESIKSYRKNRVRREKPEEILCKILNRFNTPQRHAIAQKLQ